MLNFKMYSQLLSCSTARGSGTGLSLVGPTKVKAYKSFLFEETQLNTAACSPGAFI